MAPMILPLFFVTPTAFSAFHGDSHPSPSRRMQQIDRSHHEVGMDPFGYRQERMQDWMGHVKDELYQNGYCIIEDVLRPDEIAQVERCLSILDSSGSLQTTPERALNVRDDAIRFNSEREAMIAVGNVIRLLKGAADAIMPVVSRQYRDSGQDPVAPATRDRPLTVTANAMIASYPNGGRYRIHSDNSCGEEDQGRLNWREITAIAYVNPSWTERDGGLLRLWPESQDISPEQFGWTDRGEQDLRDHLRQTWPERRGHHQQAKEYVEVEPIAGRMVLFRSHLLHEVRPSLAESRRAITCWFLRPVVDGIPCHRGQGVL